MKKIVVLLLLVNSVFAQSKKDFTIDDIFVKRLFVPSAVSGLRSMKDGKTYVSIERNPVTRQLFVARNNYSDGKVASVLFTSEDLKYRGKQLPVSTDFDAGENKLLIANEEEAIYRHSTRANYFVYDLKTKIVTPVSLNGKQMFATFSPDGKKVAFVRDNNIYIKDLVSLTEKKITTDGKFNKIINGGTDWVYEEEFSFTTAFFWSPDSKMIAYYKFNETEVPEFAMTMYDGLYPSEYKYKYPKAGEKNSIVSIHVYSLDRKNTITIPVGPEKDQYIPRIKWTNNLNTLCILRMNRHQNKLEYLFADAVKGTARVMLTLTDKYYLDVNDDLTFLNNGKEFVLTDETDGYNHVYMYDTYTGKKIRQVTAGDWEVTTLYGVDEHAGTIYYQSTESSPLQRDVYSIRLDGTDKKKISTVPGTNTAVFSEDFSYVIMTNSSAKTPLYTTLNDKYGKVVRVLEDNAAVKTNINEYNVGLKEFFQITTSGNVKLNAYMIKPPNFDATKKYPVLMFVYGGPGSQKVADNWYTTQDTWLAYMATKGYIIACVDNRGTGFRGAEFKKMTYKELGKYETIDQIEAAKWLAKQSYVDSKRVGIWGWSYGGYMSSLCITKGADVFSMAIAVSPVTTWRFYDSIYTERYLQTPQENKSGYDDNSPINFANMLKGRFLLVHGSGDDNVHFQNSMMFSEALIQANKPFEQAYYPNKAHSLTGGKTTLHLYNKLTDFVLGNL